MPTQETIGYVDLEGVCTQCGEKVDIGARTCPLCGGQVSRRVKSQIKSGAPLETSPEAAAAGENPMIECPACGTENAWNAEHCSQCGSSLAQGKKREGQGVIGAFNPHSQPDIICPTCRHSNPVGSDTCEKCGVDLQESTVSGAAPYSGGGSMRRHSARSRPTAPSWVPPMPTNTRRSFSVPRGVWIGLAIAAGAALLGFLLWFFVIKTEPMGFQVVERWWQSITYKQEYVEKTGERWHDEGYPAGAENVRDTGTVMRERDTHTVSGRNTKDPHPYTSSLPEREVLRNCGDPYPEIESGSAWRTEIPANATIGTCERRLKSTEDSEVSAPAYGEVKKVCGTPYVIDKGGEKGAVVQDCMYEIRQDYCDYKAPTGEMLEDCRYEVKEQVIKFDYNIWETVDSFPKTGSDLTPTFYQTYDVPSPKVGDIRQIEGPISYNVHFLGIDTEDDGIQERVERTEVVDFEWYAQCEPGTRWTLHINRLNAVMKHEPAN